MSSCLGSEVKTNNAKSTRIFAAVTSEEKGALEAVAAFYKVDVPTLIRWWVSEAVGRAWEPAHLRKLKRAEKK